MRAGNRDRTLTAATGVLEGLVERDCLSRRDFSLVLRAASHADDPQFALGFAAVVTHHDPREIPIAETVETLIRENRRYRLLWPPERWKRKSVQVSRARRFAPPPVRYTDRARWLDRCLPSDRRLRRRLRVLDTPNRLYRESLRQGIRLHQLDARLRRGLLAGISVLVARKRYTVILHVPTGWQRPRLHSIRGAGGAPLDERSRSAIVDVLGDAIDMTPASRRTWRAAARIATAGVGLLALLATAPVEPAMPRIPGIYSCALGIGLYAIRQLLPEAPAWSRRLSAGVFATVWLAPALAAALAIHFPIALTLDQWHTSQGIVRQLIPIPICYLAAALAWPLASRWWHTRPRR